MIMEKAKAGIDKLKALCLDPTQASRAGTVNFERGWVRPQPEELRSTRSEALQPFAYSGP